MVGSAISCYGGIDSTAGADSAICYLLPDGVPTPDYKTDPSVISQVMTAVVGSCPAGAGFTPTDKCFVTTYDQSLFHPGDWRFVVEFYKSGSLINLAGIDYRVHTFFVLPESPMGAAALTGSSLASLGAFVLHKKRKSKQSPPPSNDHSLGQ